MKIKRSVIPVLACCSALLICCCMFVSAKAQSQREAVIPSLTDVQNTGYPINEAGETYGPDSKDPSMKSPDLVLAENENGLIGYIRESEIAGASITNPEEAANYVPHSHYINMYLEDGITVIGQFLISE